MMDMALAIDRLVPAAQYGGSTTANTQQAFDALVWEDARPKPLWTDIQTQMAQTYDFSSGDLASLNIALAQPGSVVRALALVMLQEINTLRTKTGLATYTQQQLVTALQAKMR